MSWAKSRGIERGLPTRTAGEGQRRRLRRVAARLPLRLVGASWLCLAATATAQTTAPTAPQADEFWIRVTASEVNVRARPDVNSTPVARVPRDTLLRATGVEYGWYRVRPPEGVFSLVAAAFIERRSADEGIVRVRSGALRVRVGSLVRVVDPERSDVQTLLENGSPVRVLGEQGAWLRIVPPAGVSFYVSSAHAERVSEETAAELHAAGTGRRAERPGPSVQSEASAEDAPDLSGPWGRQLLEVESAIAAEARRPALEQQWGELMARLRPIALQREEPMVAELARRWMTQLEERLAQRPTLRAAEELIRRSAREQSQHEREVERIARLRQRAATQPAFAAQGALRRSQAVSDAAGRRFYQLQDPVTHRVEAYLRTVPGGPELEPHVGRYVGVRGPRSADPRLGADVVEVRELVILGELGPATQPASARG